MHPGQSPAKVRRARHIRPATLASVARRNSVHRLAAVVLLALASGCRPSPPPDIAAIPHTPIPKVDAHLRITLNPAGISYQGRVADSATRDMVLAAIEAAPAKTRNGELRVDPDTHPAAWAGNLQALLAVFPASGGILVLVGDTITLSGSVSQEDRARLLRKARLLFPNHRLAGLFRDVDMRHALPDAGDEAGLVAFLNKLPIQFLSASGMLAPASVRLLPRAARAIRTAATPQTRLLVGVYPESDSAEDIEIAMQRAEAIQTQLALRGISPTLLRTVPLPPTPGHAALATFSLAQPDTMPTPAGTMAATDGDGEQAPPPPASDH